MHQTVPHTKRGEPEDSVVEAIRADMESREQEAHAIELALESEREMLASGMAYDGQDVMAWLHARAEGRRVAPPQPKPLAMLAPARA